MQARPSTRCERRVHNLVNSRSSSLPSLSPRSPPSKDSQSDRSDRHVRTKAIKRNASLPAVSRRSNDSEDSQIDTFDRHLRGEGSKVWPSFPSKRAARHQQALEESREWDMPSLDVATRRLLHAEARRRFQARPDFGERNNNERRGAIWDVVHAPKVFKQVSEDILKAVRVSKAVKKLAPSGEVKNSALIEELKRSAPIEAEKPSLWPQRRMALKLSTRCSSGSSTGSEEWTNRSTDSLVITENASEQENASEEEETWAKLASTLIA